MSDPRPVGNFNWTDEAVETLKRMVAEGKSYGQIGRALGCSRCAAIGKFNRSGGVRPTKASAPLRAPRVARAQYQNASLNFRAPPKPVPAAGLQWGAKSSPVPVGPTPFVERVEPAGKKTLLQLLGHDCKWGVGDPSSDGFRFCAEPQQAGSSYCPHHHRRAYTAPKTPPKDLARSLRRYA